MKKLTLIFLTFLCLGSFAQNDLSRNKVQDSIQALSATVSLSDLKTILDDNFANSGVFKKDIINNGSAAGNTFTADFDSIDTYQVDAGAASVTITISNMQDGQVGWIDVINKADKLVVWSNADNITPNASALTALSTVLYMVVNKNNDIFVQAWIAGSTVTTATETNTGILEVATTAEALALSSDAKIITPSKFDDILGSEVLLKTDTISIGDWNMDATTSVSVAHGIGDHEDIVSVFITIRDDAATSLYPLFYYTGVGVSDGRFLWNATNIVMTRRGGGNFDDTDFNATSYNRGIITIFYLD